jgi:hypothetical protein
LALQSKYAIVQSEKADLKRASAKLSKQLESLRTDLDRFNKEAVQVLNLILRLRLIRIRDPMSF